MTEKIKTFHQRLSEIDFFSPSIFFPLVLFFYHIFGNIFDGHRSKLFDLEFSTYPLIFTAVITYYIVWYFVNKKNVMLPSISVSWISKFFILGVIVVTVIGFASLSYMLLTGQIGLLDESIRRNINPKLNFLSAFFWFGYLILITEYISRKNLSKKKSIILLLTSSLVVLSLYVLIGYRTNLFMIVFTLVLFFHYHFKRFNIKWVVLFLTIVSVSFSLFGHMRVVNEDKTVAFNNNPVEEVKLDTKTKTNIKKVNKMPEWYRVITAEFVNGKIVLSRIIQSTDENGTLKGQLHLAALKTILPGENKSPRTIVTEKVNHLSNNGIPVTREGRTTTPSLLGQLFLDGGYVLLVIGVAICSFLLSSIYNRLKSTGESNYKIAYSFLTVLLVISIHTGFLDVVFFAFFIAMIAHSIIKQKNTI
ncbi:oligosaccharide repeat unit polymerase [Bacillus cereus]|uniref:oligosaccharide repeat unit polymerase n=1 Tax=Bacillus cereus TaxID=1396 RepID=UPI000B4AA355|nr:oligosaccharide repeat unit polymerase [Bacillus cereus]